MTGQYGHPPYRLPGTGTGLPSRPQPEWKGVPDCLLAVSLLIGTILIGIITVVLTLWL